MQRAKSHSPTVTVLSSGSWDDYRLLLAVAASGSMQSAAQELGVATSTVSRKIAAWESRLGAKLVDRRSAGALLTAAGGTLTLLAREIDERVRATEASLSASDEALAGPVRLTAGEGMADVLLPLLAEFQRSYPNVRVELAADSRARNLEKREADLAIRAVRPKGSNLLTRKLGTFSFGLYAAPDYLARRGTPRSLRELAPHAFVSLSSEQASMRAVSWLKELGVERVVLRVNSGQLLLSAVREGIGIGVVAHQLAGGLTRVLPSQTTERHAIWLVRHSDTKSLRRLNLFADFIVLRLSALADATPR
ncbi:MAG: Transcriptional regulator, LysR family protein [Myxococcaceae bacterium]|nr:Transcriptional regulator, LysR family protein [Myxococcaceae bacterium]